MDKILEQKCNGKLLLNEALYGLVQASREFYKKLSMFLIQDMGYEKCLAEACLMRRDRVILIIYVDDLLFVGPKDEVDVCID